MSDILTAQELSEYLKITTTTIYKLAQKGQIPSFKIGSDWRFKKNLVDQWVEERTVRPMRKVLVVDDEVEICQMFSRALDKKRFNVDSAYSGLEAVTAAQKTPYDIIFLDLKMPGMNGVDTFRELLKLNIQAIIVIVTGYPDSELLLEAMKLGPFSVILKPLDLKEVQRSLESFALVGSK